MDCDTIHPLGSTGAIFWWFVVPEEKKCSVLEIDNMVKIILEMVTDVGLVFTRKIRYLVKYYILES